MISRIGKKLVGVGWIFGILSAVLANFLIGAYLAPEPGPPSPRMAPIVYRCDELAPSPEERETWEEYAARMEAEGKEPVR